jgi:hypothetical protein
MRLFDRTIGVLLLLSVVLHCVGTFYFFPLLSPIFVQSLGSGVAGFLIGGLNLVRAGRPNDRTVGLFATIGAAAWLAIAVLFNLSLGNILDPRGSVHALLALILVFLGIRTLMQAKA